ncbi:GNAT family N-acetyltransferase [Limosilactobacillus sp. STM2_1]|uniref:GNAT family N-acetyltransferase n=1 Tax=Limosilactobacillus rudii TaxID=2759755 RepID=A0A7W3UKF3_9LACO|nr:GNAT family N-acetyltransferase [Limosilactobacillus rudii]MBB1078567.1 GNAT family N-acetyltransferase [Limosilactobacillus rudii]MBB1097207.1 GNAT family N-acetyltransferase [Limosilactobacillus rudii]MCD7133877.1 GNAT family N-acetyltransferase [Limosilactobacillus rudii]
MKIEHVVMADLPAILDIERAGFSPAEAGSKAAFVNRIENIPDTFLVAKEEEQVVGFIVGPVTSIPAIDDKYYEHVAPNLPVGDYLCVLSLAVAPEFQRKGIGSQLLSAFVNVARNYHCQQIILDSLAKNIPFYEANGFNKAGISLSNHADETWFNMVKNV